MSVIFRLVAWLVVCKAQPRRHRNNVVGQLSPGESFNESASFVGYKPFAGLYACPENGEAYSAGYLGSRSTFLRHLVPAHRLIRGQGNMEGASHTMFRNNRLHKTVDLFDFYIEHLSWYERRLFKGAESVRSHVIERLKRQTAHRSTTSSGRLDAVALMPFYATAGGDSGHSALESRRIFLNMTHQSLAPHFGKIVVCVATDFDESYLARSGLHFFDVLRAHVFKPSRLGFATVHLAQQRLLSDQRWADVRYIFYTESDQIFHIRDLALLLKFADQSPPSLLLPHRVMPVPVREDLGALSRDENIHLDAMREFTRNAAKTLHRIKVGDVQHASCCFDPAPCGKNRRGHWRYFSDRAIELFQLIPDEGATHSFQTSFALVAGEGNFLRQHFRACHLCTRSRSFCRSGSVDPPQMDTTCEDVVSSGFSSQPRRRIARGRSSLL